MPVIGLLVLDAPVLDLGGSRKRRHHANPVRLDPTRSGGGRPPPDDL